MNQAALLLFAAFLSYALAVTTDNSSTGYHTIENAVPHSVPTFEEVRAQQAENDPLAAEEVELLARIVSAEARNEPYQGQVAVAAVVLNRVEEDGFGDSIEEVIFAKGQFQPVRNGSIHRTPVESAYDAAWDALNGNDPTKGAVYFANMDIADHHPNPNAVKTVKIGDHTFFK